MKTESICKKCRVYNQSLNSGVKLLHYRFSGKNGGVQIKMSGSEVYEFEWVTLSKCKKECLFDLEQTMANKNENRKHM